MVTKSISKKFLLLFLVPYLACTPAATDDTTASDTPGGVNSPGNTTQDNPIQDLAIDDLSLAGGSIAGTIRLSTSVVSSSVSSYSFYFADEDFEVLNNGFLTVEAASTELVVEIPEGVSIPNGTSYIVVYPDTAEGQSESFFSLKIRTMVPQGTPQGFSFTDVDYSQGFLGGEFSITKANVEWDASHYYIYWGDATSHFTSSGIVRQIEPIGEDLSFTLVSGSTVLAGVSHAWVFLANEYGIAETGVSVAVEDLSIPSESVGTVSPFYDFDDEANELQGDLTFLQASDESNITHYVVYWGSDATTKLNDTAVVEIAASAQASYTHTIASNTALPAGASHFLVFTKNQFGDSLSSQSVAITDQTVPLAPTQIILEPSTLVITGGQEDFVVTMILNNGSTFSPNSSQYSVNYVSGSLDPECNGQGECICNSSPATATFNATTALGGGLTSTTNTVSCE